MGSFPSSYVFSILVDAFSEKSEEDQYRYAWMITMCYNFVGLLYVIIAGIFRYKIKGDLLGETNDKNNIEKNENNNENETNKEDNTENEFQNDNNK